MRPAPPVQVRCHSAGWMAFQTGCAGLAAGVWVVWCLMHLDLPVWPAWIAAAVVAAMFARLLRHESESLVWNGQVWLLNGREGRLDLMLDMGFWLLLRWRAPRDGRARWLPVSARGAGPALLGLRAALYAYVPAQVMAPATQRRDARRKQVWP